MTEHAPAARLVFPGLQSFYDGVVPYVYPLIRFTVGVMFLPHVWVKLKFGAAAVAANVMAKRGYEPALMFAYIIIFLESVGAICVAIGLLTRGFAAALAVEMAVITFGVHMANGYGFSSPGGGGEFPLMWGILLFAIALRGGGNLSVDRNYLGREI